MRFRRGRRYWPILIAVLALSPARVGRTDDPPSSSPTSPTIDEADQTLNRALELERKRDWAAAIELYEFAVEHWPGRAVFRHRRLLCETHYRLGRRYQDQSFRAVLLRLPFERALDLYEEVLDRIQSQYVEGVSLEPLTRRGLDNFEVALRDPAFLKVNAPEAAPEAVKALREALIARRVRISARDRTEARAQVLSVCELAKRTLGIGRTPVILEFIFGACDALDDYSSYLTPDRLDDLFATIDGSFVGLGVELKHDESGLRVVGVISGGPAADAGIKPGDRIVKVEGRSLAGLSIDEASNKLQGAEGSPVTISIVRLDGTTRELRLIRRPVEVKSVSKAGIVDSRRGVGYVHFTSFQKSSGEEMRRAIARLTEQGMRILVLDLRGNPGGLLNVAVELADEFLNEGVIVSTRGRAAGQTAVFRARQGSPWNMPLIVLVDHESASASEILAGALQENRRATIIGERSYGKGSVQSIFTLRAAPAGLKLTTAKFYSPRGRAYSEQGVEPDVEVASARRRSSAKPASEPIDDLEAIDSFGNPGKDLALKKALELIK